jgi:hypothetical protein
MKKYTTLIRKWFPTWIGVVVGAVAGYAYWYNVGCASGGCAITSSPVNSTLYGMMMKGLVGNMFMGDKPKESTKMGETE